LGDDDPRWLPAEVKMVSNRPLQFIAGVSGREMGHSIALLYSPIQHDVVNVFYAFFIPCMLIFLIVAYHDTILLNSRFKIRKIIQLVPVGRKKEYFTLNELEPLINQ
jgi:hypothetical protein